MSDSLPFISSSIPTTARSEARAWKVWRLACPLHMSNTPNLLLLHQLCKPVLPTGWPNGRPGRCGAHLGQIYPSLVPTLRFLIRQVHCRPASGRPLGSTGCKLAWLIDSSISESKSLITYRSESLSWSLLSFSQSRLCLK
jgi:hypothetical protein